jgi:vancomycin resistance protein VanJ
MRRTTNLAHRTQPWSTWLTVLTCIYVAVLFGLTALRLVYGDHWGWLFALNALTPYWFLPLPIVLGAAWITRQRAMWISLGLGVALGAYLYGGLFMPRAPVANAAGPTLRVMTYNLLGFNFSSDAVIKTIHASQADVIALQELNPQNAAAIQRDLAETYPYQYLNPQDGVSGAGVISRYPLQPTGEKLPGDWVSAPQILTLTVADRDITFVRFHAYAGVDAVTTREQEAQILADFVAAHAPHHPLIAAGDLNATDMNRAYGQLTSVLHDSWREAGLGFGHTFPGSADTPGNSRPRLLGLAVPPWLVRIDYVFYAGGLAALSAHTGPWDGASDHQAMVAELTLLR